MIVDKLSRVERSERIAWGVLAAMVLVFLAAAATSRWFNDDVFITFRYADNLAHGHGFTWNIVEPEPVEGTTSLGWMVLAALAIKLGLHPTIVAHLVGMLAGAAVLVLAYWGGRRLLELPPGWALLAPAFLVLNRQHVLWSVSGLETKAAGAVAFAATLLLALALVREQRALAIASGALFFAGSLLRPETPLLHLAAGLGCLVAAIGASRLVLVALSGATHIAALGMLTAWRLWLFGQPLPNTFYVKVGGLQSERGLAYVEEFVRQYHGALFVPVIVAGVLIVGRKSRPTLFFALLVQLLFYVAWIIASGGGRWEFRYFDPVLPALALLVAASLYAWGRGLSDAPSTTRRRVVIALVGLAIVATQVSTFFVPYRPYDQQMGADDLHDAAREMLREGSVLRRVLGPDDRISIGWAGAVPYLTRAWHFDPWGLNEREARNWPFEPEGVVFHQRHATWEQIAESGALAVDVFNQFLYRRPEHPARLAPRAQPWARSGVVVHCVRIPGEEELPYWIFASPRPMEEVEAFIADKRLERVYSLPLRLDEGPSLAAP